MIVRRYQATDLERVVAVFTAAIHTLASDHYDEIQRSAWAPQSPDLDEWRHRLALVQTVIVEEGDRLAGFLSYESDGHIDLLYTAPQCARSGVASALYRHVEAQLHSSGVQQLFTEASLVARPFFERHGFRVREEQTVHRRGISFRRFRMCKSLTGATIDS
ncbi:GNAT family N-acetyltransferase [Povalibacter sp.]|uniref:GNAT family N-acetyltransferase n=1 Tax=Povalibacter sp. TaxID=1962978 RepID=UPI002F3F185E